MDCLYVFYFELGWVVDSLSVYFFWVLVSGFECGLLFPGFVFIACFVIDVVLDGVVLGGWCFTSALVVLLDLLCRFVCCCDGLYFSV